MIKPRLCEDGMISVMCEGTGGTNTRRSHVVPAFYLRNFSDPRKKIWAFDKRTGKLFISTPEKLGTVRDYYRGEHAVHEDDLEHRLASIESGAAPQFRALIGGAVDLSPEFARFLAWMLARSEWVRRLGAHFNFRRYLTDNYEELCRNDDGSQGRPLPLRFRNSSGEAVVVPLKLSWQYLESSEWDFEVTQDMFLDMVRMQAYCFQTIHFPRLKWVKLTPPLGRRFITSDRPASWDVLGSGWQDFPVALKHPGVDLIFPVSPELALMAGHDQALMLASDISPREVNRRIADRADRYLFAREKDDLETLALPGATSIF